jgi:predicted permease
MLVPIFIGFVAGRYLKIERDSIASLLFYLIAPIVFFNSITRTTINLTTLSLPIIVYLISSIICLIFYFIGKKIWVDSTKNILALSAGNGNTGYFGLPLAMTLFDEVSVGIYMISIIGVVLYENTVGYFITAKGSYDAKTSLIRVLKLPMLHAFILACIFSLCGFKFPKIFDEFMVNLRGCYVILGMMLVGIGISTIESFKLDFKFISLSFIAKFIAWPIIVFLLITIDKNYFHYYSVNIYEILTLLSIVPLAANTVIIASILKANPEKAATAILTSMLFSLIYVPLMVMLFIPR